MDNFNDTSTNVLSENKDVITENKDVITENKDVITENMDVITENMDVITENIDVVTENMDVITENMDVITENMDVITENIDVRTDHPNNVQLENMDVITDHSTYALPKTSTDVHPENSDVGPSPNDQPENVEVKNQQHSSAVNLLRKFQSPLIKAAVVVATLSCVAVMMSAIWNFVIAAKNGKVIFK